MAEVIGKLFSSAPSLERVNPLGLIVMALGALLAVSAKRISRALPEEKRPRVFIALKLASVLICIAGFVTAII